MAGNGNAKEIGDEVEDGTVYAGLSPDTGRAMYATPKDASGAYDFNEAAGYAEDLGAHGHNDWRVPSKGELNVLWENCDKGRLKGTFNKVHDAAADVRSDPTVWYWTSSRSFHVYAWSQRFSDGMTGNVGDMAGHASLRCVRG